eukprot:5084911-Pleurochrysis_carterae.AAC.1
MPRVSNYTTTVASQTGEATELELGMIQPWSHAAGHNLLTMFENVAITRNSCSVVSGADMLMIA